MSKSQNVLQEIEKQAENQNIPLVGPVKGQILVDLIKVIKPARILEIGTNVGYSSILMAQAVSEDSKGSHITTIEINPQTAEVAEKNIEKSGLRELINIKVGDAKKVIDNFMESFDMVFIDAEKEEYLDYLMAIEPKLNQNAIIVADNVGIFAETLRNYLNYVRGSGKFESTTFNFIFDAVEVSKYLGSPAS